MPQLAARGLCERFSNDLKSKPDLLATVKPHAVVVTTGAGVVEAVVVLV
jgi:hypothetical protein